MRHTKYFVLLSLPLLSAFIFSCAAGDGSPGVGDGDGDGDTGSGASTGDGDGDIVIGDGDTGSGGSTDKPPAMVETTLPPGFTPANNAGGYKIVGKLSAFSEDASNSCANVLRLIARDFTTAHIDFGQEKPATWASDGQNGLYVGQILPDLPEETRKPVINPNRMPLDVIEKFEDWYVNLEDEGINIPYVMDIWLEPDPTRPGYFVYDDTLFFPLDEVNENPEDVQPGDGGNYNFLFTTELHTAFEYKGGEVFTFRGDDDVFAFINGKLAVDIGGIHGPVERSVDLDAQAATLDLEIGNVYSLELFQAERNPGGSNYRIDTSLDFKECGILEDDIVVK